MADESLVKMVSQRGILHHPNLFSKGGFAVLVKYQLSYLNSRTKSIAMLRISPADLLMSLERFNVSSPELLRRYDLMNKSTYREGQGYNGKIVDRCYQFGSHFYA
jgi:hypothetical protein